MPSEQPIMPPQASPHRVFQGLHPKAGRTLSYLWIGLVACLLLVVGSVLWHNQGAAVFTALVSAALAWCF